MELITQMKLKDRKSLWYKLNEGKYTYAKLKKLAEREPSTIEQTLMNTKPLELKHPPTRHIEHSVEILIGPMEQLASAHHIYKQIQHPSREDRDIYGRIFTRVVSHLDKWVYDKKLVHEDKAETSEEDEREDERFKSDRPVAQKKEPKKSEWREKLYDLAYGKERERREAKAREEKPKEKVTQEMIKEAKESVKQFKPITARVKAKAKKFDLKKAKEFTEVKEAEEPALAHKARDFLFNYTPKKRTIKYKKEFNEYSKILRESLEKEQDDLFDKKLDKQILGRLSSRHDARMIFNGLVRDATPFNEEQTIWNINRERVHAPLLKRYRELEDEISKIPYYRIETDETDEPVKEKKPKLPKLPRGKKIKDLKKDREIDGDLIYWRNAYFDNPNMYKPTDGKWYLIGTVKEGDYELNETTLLDTPIPVPEYYKFYDTNDKEIILK